MEASALATASRRGLLGRRSPVLRLSTDERLVELIRDHHDRAFEVLFDRYQARLFAFCRHMLPSDQDAEDVLQDVFVSAHRAMIADDRQLNVRPWLYRIARNRCLNHLRKRTADGQDSMDEHMHMNGTSTAEQVQNREDLRELLREVKTLPETQRTALLLREVDALSYTEIAQSMDTTVPAVKSLLVRARVTLAEASQARLLTCGEVRLQLAESAEGLRKVEGPVRHHIRRCDECSDFREQLHSNSKALAALFPIGPLAALKGFLLAKLGIGGSSGGGAATGGVASGGAAAGGGSVAAGGSAAVAGGAAAGGGAITSAIGGMAGGGAGLGGAVSGALGAKAAAGVATAALLTAGAVEVKHYVSDGQRDAPAAQVRSAADDKLADAHQTRAPAVAESRDATPAAADERGEQADQPVVAEAPVTEEATVPVVAETPTEPETTTAEQTAPTSSTADPDPGPITIDPGHGTGSSTTGTAIVGPGGGTSTGTTTAPPPLNSADPATQPPPPPPPDSGSGTEDETTSPADPGATP